MVAVWTVIVALGLVAVSLGLLIVAFALRERSERKKLLEQNRSRWNDEIERRR
jgi:uncharacterized membrane protein